MRDLDDIIASGGFDRCDLRSEGTFARCQKQAEHSGPCSFEEHIELPKQEEREYSEAIERGIGGECS